MPPLIQKHLLLPAFPYIRCTRSSWTAPRASLRTAARPSRLVVSQDHRTRGAPSTQNGQQPSKRRRLSKPLDEDDDGDFKIPGEEAELGGDITDAELNNFPIELGPLTKSLKRLSEVDLESVLKQVVRPSKNETITHPDRAEERDLEDNLLPGRISKYALRKDVKVQPDDVIPRHSRVLLKTLNSYLADAAKKPLDPKIRQQVWRWYDRSKFNVPHFLKMIPRKAWDLIWLTQSQESPKNPNRLVHLGTIAQDMAETGWALSAEQKVIRIEGMFMADKLDEASKAWEAEFDALRDDARYLNIGIHLQARSMNLDRALQLLDELLRLHPNHDSQPIVTVLYSFARSGQPEHLDIAWSLYHRLKQFKGPQVSIADYDSVSLAFLELGHKNHAFAIFRDMMLDRNVWESVGNKAALDRISRLSKSRGTVDHLRNIAPDDISYLPKSLQNRFFYASWLRKLIAEGKLNEAGQVFDLMYERGIRPDAHHVNGFINALFRTSDLAARENAESLGWAMIQARLELCQQQRLRKTGQYVKKRSIWDVPEGINIPPIPSQKVPPATIETFSLLVEHYLEKQKLVHVRHLRDLIPEAELRMNSFLMNHLLAAELKNRGLPYIWARFQLMSKTTKPDMLTYKMLWECLKYHLARLGRRPVFSDIPSPRQLLAQMMADFRSSSSRERASALEDFDLSIYNNILRSFFLTQDIEGAFIAMVTAKESLQVYPVPDTVSMIIKQISKLEERFLPQPLSRAESVKARTERNQHEASIAFATIARDRVKRLEDDGRHWNDLNALQKAEEGQRTLLALLLGVVKKRQKSMGAIDFQRAITEACEELQLDPINVDLALELAPRHLDTKGDVV